MTDVKLILFELSKKMLKNSGKNRNSKLFNYTATFICTLKSRILLITEYLNSLLFFIHLNKVFYCAQPHAYYLLYTFLFNCYNSLLTGKNLNKKNLKINFFLSTK